MIYSLRPGARYFLTFSVYIGIFRGRVGKRKREKGNRSSPAAPRRALAGLLFIGKEREREEAARQRVKG